jgi:hypothetical protein
LTVRRTGLALAKASIHDGGRLRVGPDGAVYLATSNRDGRGDRVGGDDRILRVAPAT